MSAAAVSRTLATSCRQQCRSTWKGMRSSCKEACRDRRREERRRQRKEERQQRLRKRRKKMVRIQKRQQARKRSRARKKQTKEGSGNRTKTKNKPTKNKPPPPVTKNKPKTTPKRPPPVVVNSGVVFPPKCLNDMITGKNTIKKGRDFKFCFAAGMGANLRTKAKSYRLLTAVTDRRDREAILNLEVETDRKGTLTFVEGAGTGCVSPGKVKVELPKGVPVKFGGSIGIELCKTGTVGVSPTNPKEVEGGVGYGVKASVEVAGIEQSVSVDTIVKAVTDDDGRFAGFEGEGSNSVDLGPVDFGVKTTVGIKLEKDGDWKIDIVVTPSIGFLIEPFIDQDFEFPLKIATIGPLSLKEGTKPKIDLLDQKVLP